MMQMFRQSVLSGKTLPAQAGGVFPCGAVCKSVPRASRRQGFAALLLSLLLLWLANQGHAAQSLTQPPAVLSWNGALLPARADVEVLRFERIEFRRFDPLGGTNLQVWSGNFASPDSLTGNAVTGAALPAPLASNGNAIVVNAPVPLSPASGYEFAGQEALFVVAEKPLEPAGGFSVRGDGRRFIAVTINIDSTDSHTITLVETAPGSNIFVGYLQPNVSGSSIVVPPGSSLSIDYDANGDVADSQTDVAPWNVSPAFLAAISAGRSTSTVSTPLPASDIFLAKQALRSSAMTGDFVAYELTLENTSGSPALNVIISDTLPRGLRFQPGSLRVDGTATANPVISDDGRTLDISAGNLPAGAVTRIRYVAEITVAAPAGQAINRAVANAGAARSNVASATVLVERPIFNDRAFLLGRVIAGNCDEDGAPGVAGVRIYMEDGSNVVTDEHGRWHIEGVIPGTHVLQLDTTTLGPRHRLRQCHDNTRQAGNPASRFVNVQGGTLWRENWYIEEKPELGAHLQQQLTTVLRDGHAVITLPIGNGETEFTEIVTRLFLPDTLTPVNGSALFDGKPVPDPEKVENFYEFRFDAKGYFWRRTLSLSLLLDPDETDSVETSILATSFGITRDGRRHTVSSMNKVRIGGATMKQNELVLRPRFPSMSAQLSATDLANIRKATESLRGIHGLRLEVLGHTDSQRIARREGRQINDNYALSQARAQAVANHLSEMLDLAPRQVTVIGKGADEPVADNDSAEGRAMNRRVTIRFFVPEKISDASLTVTQPDSGLNNDRSGTESDRNSKTDIPSGLLNVSDGMVTPYPVISVTARMDARLKPKLLLNGSPVADERIGMRLADDETKTVVYTWVGIELPKIGEYQLELQGIGGFGVVRFSENVTLRRSGRIKSILSGAVIENSADGITPVQTRIRLIDEFNQPILAQTELRIVSGSLRPLNHSQSGSPLEDRGDVLIVDRDGIARFEPVGTAGTYRIRLTDGQVVSEEIEVPVSPDLRDWILVGFAEGSVGYNTLRGNMQKPNGADQHAYSDGEMAFFARGTIQGEWLLTAAYDSRRASLQDQPRQGAIDPQRWYTLYGDDTQRQHDAASSEKLYVRMEKRDFYVLFGDYDTGLTVTELGRYQRVLTGVKSEWTGRNMSAQGFAAEAAQGFVRDDIQPDGTSGLYRTSRTGIIPGTEVISIEVRDRFTNALISSTPMSRFIDYSFDATDGSFFFRQPVPVQDASFNPLRIVVTYEVESGLDEHVAGGRVTVFDDNRQVVVGVSGVHDTTTGSDASLAATDITWKPDDQHTVKAELAGSRDNLAGNDQAWLAEHQFVSEKLDTRVRVEQTDAGFGLGQVSSQDDDMRLLQAGARYRFDESLALSTDLSRQQLLTSSSQRDVAEGRLEYQRENWQAFGGLRYAGDQNAAGDFSSRQLIAGGRRDLMDKRLSLHATGETGLDDQDNADYPQRLMLGSDYRLNSKVTLFANQEFTWGYNRRTQDSRVGARARPWQGGTVTSEVSRTMDEYGPRMMAHAGLFQTIELTSQWTADVGFDRAQTLTDGPTVDGFDPRRAPASGTATSDYTAVSGGIGYRDAAWQWTNRVEFRQAETDDKWNLLSGFQHRLDATDTLAGRVLHFDQQFRNGDILRSSELDVSWARRPLYDGIIWLNRSRIVYDEQRTAAASLFGHRLINNTHMNFVHADRHQLSFQYSARYVGETIDATRYTGYTDLVAAEYRFDLTERWDIGSRGSSMNSYNSDIRSNAIGVMVGFSPVRDIWLSLGYNFRGFYDADFNGAEGRVQGIVLDFRIKFDQGSVRNIRGEQP